MTDGDCYPDSTWYGGAGMRKRFVKVKETRPSQSLAKLAEKFGQGCAGVALHEAEILSNHNRQWLGVHASALRAESQSSGIER